MRSTPRSSTASRNSAPDAGEGRFGPCSVHETHYASAERNPSYLSGVHNRGAPVLRETQLDDVLDLLDVRVRAFAICEIGRRYSLRCTAHDDVVLHFVLDGHGM